MEDENNFEIPYYDVTYLDDNNTKHMAKFRHKEDVEYIQDRFVLESYNFVNIQ